MAAKLTVAFLFIAVLALLGAWRAQTSAGDALAAARQVQEAEVPDSDSDSASVRDYRAIVSSLEKSIAIRSEIDGLLGEVEEIVGNLNKTQQQAIETARVTRDEVGGIGHILSGSIDASRDSLEGLRVLRKRLARSAELSRLIADELEELDESLGPTVELP